MRARALQTCSYHAVHGKLSERQRQRGTFIGERPFFIGRGYCLSTWPRADLLDLVAAYCKLVPHTA
eukprot:3591973-Rhodomonas_salina.1